MERKVILIALVFLIMLVPTGCWSRYETEEMAIVSSIGIDKTVVEGKEKFLLTLSIIRPALAGGGTEGGGGKGEPIFWRLSAVGDTLVDAERNADIRSPRRIFYGHARFAVIGEEIARERFMEVIDYFHRNPEIRLRVYLLLTRGKAVDKLIKFPEYENTVAEMVEKEATQTSRWVSKIEIRNLAEITDELVSPGIDPVIIEARTLSSPPTVPGKDSIEVFNFGGGAVFDKDRLVGWLEKHEIRGYLLATGRAKQGVYPIKLKNHGRPDVSIQFTRVTSKTEVKALDGDATATIRIRAEGDLGEFHGTEEIASDQGVKQLESQFKKAIEQEVTRVIKKGQRLNADIFGFGAMLRRSDYKAWKKVEKNWDKIYRDMDVKLEVTAHVRRTGLISDPYKAQ